MPDHLPYLVPGADYSSAIEVDTFEKFAHATSRLINCSATERPQWNTEATVDAIRHFAWGISDDNPLWIDHCHAQSGPHGRIAAPPTFLISILYPFLHGAPSLIPLTFLISELSCHWYVPVLEGDSLKAESVYKDVIQSTDREARNTLFIVSKCTYRNQRNEIVGVIEGTIAAIERSQNSMMIDRQTHEYSAEEIEALGAAHRSERRTEQSLVARAIEPGEELPPIIRGPLTIGDLISWQAAVGPAYRSGSLAYQDLLANPHRATVLPGVGWPVPYSQQHEDMLLCRQRGLPAPFDNGAMRAAWLSVLLTDWMGDDGFLTSMQVRTIRPVIYGDVVRYSGRVTRKSTDEESATVTIRINGTNQLGEVTTTGEATVSFLNRLRKTENRSTSRLSPEKCHAVIDWGPSVAY